MNKFGIHCPNKGFRELEAMLAMGVDNFTLLHGEAWLGPRIRQARPNAVILVRHYLTNWHSHDPVAWARECAARANDMRSWTDHHVLANEQNLEHEGGGTSRAWYESIDAWNYRSIAQFKQLCPWALVHWPALASGHSEDQDDLGDGTVGYEICRPSIELADILDHHDYWFFPDQLYDAELATWHAFRFTRAHTFFPDKPIFISECGWFGHNRDPAAADHYLHFFHRLYNYPYVIGATPFIWETGPEHPGQTWVGNTALIQAITATAKPEVNQEEEMLPPWMKDIRLEVDYDTGRRRERIIGITLHHDGNRDRPSLANLLAYYKRGEAEDSYHFLIGADGSVWYLNALNRIVWHAGDTASGPWNRGGVAVVFHGYLMGQGRPTEAQFASFRRLRKWLREERLVPETVISHKEARRPQWSTDCCGDWWSNIEGFVPSELLQAPPPQPYDYEALYIQAMLERGQALDAMSGIQDALGHVLESTKQARMQILRLEEILKGEGG